MHGFALSPDHGWIAKSRKRSHVMEKVKWILLMQLVNRGTGPFLPKDIINPQSDREPSQLLRPFGKIEVDKTW